MEGRNQMYYYTACGLAIGSDLKLPELSPGIPGPLDITIRFGAVPSPASAPDPDHWQCFRATREDAAFIWEKKGCYAVKGGTEIIISAAAEADARFHRIFVLGAGLATIFHQRGFLVLHASAVAVRGQAVVFMGRSGFGKSTIAAAMCAHGHALLADDVAVVDATGTAPMVLPISPHLRLWPASLSHFGHVTAELPRLHPTADKRWLRPPDSPFSGSPCPLAAAVSLASGATTSFDPICSLDSVFALMRYSFCARGAFRGLMLDPRVSPSHLALCAKIAAQATVAQLTRPMCFSDLETHIVAVEAGLDLTVRPPTTVARLSASVHDHASR